MVSSDWLESALWVGFSFLSSFPASFATFAKFVGVVTPLLNTKAVVKDFQFCVVYSLKFPMLALDAKVSQ